jgi:hypothetical protein
MNNQPIALFEVVINGKQTGCVGKWNRTSMAISSQWDAGSDQEKFEVLAAIRRTYNPETKTDIRGLDGQTPSQIGRSEGFKELRYERSTSSSPQIIIVPPVMQYLRIAPQPTTDHSNVLLIGVAFPRQDGHFR